MVLFLPMLINAAVLLLSARDLHTNGDFTLGTDIVSLGSGDDVLPSKSLVLSSPMPLAVPLVRICVLYPLFESCLGHALAC